MKRILTYAFSISLAIVLAFLGIGIINYVNKQDNVYGDSFSAEIYELKNSMSDLYIDKEAHEKDLKEIEEKIDYWIFEQEMVKNEQTGHQTELENIELFLEDLQLRIEETADNQQLLLQKAEYEEDKAEIEEKLADCEARLSAISVELSTLETKVSTIEEQLSAVNEEIDSLQSQIDDLYARVNALNRNIITGIFTAGSGLVSPKTYYTIPLVSKVAIGNKLSVNSNGEIVIGANVSKVLVSYSVQVKPNQAYDGQRFCYCFKNGTMFSQTATYLPEVVTTHTMSSSPFLLSVAQGDKLSLVFYTYSSNDLVIENASSYRTYMTVEVVE